MGNMSYCKYQNTATDLSDCVESDMLSDDLEEMSDEERRARKSLISICKDIAEDFADKDE